MTRAMRMERGLLACGAVGAPLFVVVFLVAGATRPGYSALRHPVSSLALGELGWVQVANFVVTGVLMLAFTAGLWSALGREGGGRAAALLMGLVGVGLLGAGLFPTDPISGYPPGAPMVPAGTSRGALHNAFSAPVFLALPAACFVVARRFASCGRKGWAAYSVGTAVVFLLGFVLAGMGFGQHPVLMPIGGLLQRLTLIVGWTWVTALALHLRRRASDAGGGRAGPAQAVPTGE